MEIPRSFQYPSASMGMSLSGCAAQCNVGGKRRGSSLETVMAPLDGGETRANIVQPHAPTGSADNMLCQINLIGLINLIYYLGPVAWPGG